MAGNLSWLRRRSVSLPLLLLLLTAICSVWISYTSWYFEESRDKYLRFSAQSSVALSKSVWIVIGDGIDLQFREVFENNTRRLSAESVIIGEMSQINGMIRVSYPLSGWVNYHQNSIIRLEELLADPNIISNISKGTCSDVISVLPDSGCIERLLSWENQWPIGNGKFGGLVGGSYSVNVIPLSLAGFYVAPSHSGARDVSQQTIKFQRSRKLLLEGEFEASQTTLSSVIRSQAMSTFQSLFDLIFFFLPEGLVQLEHIPTSEPSDTMKSRMDMLHEMQKLLFGKLIQLSNGVFSMGNARLVYERNLLQAREGVTRSHHVIELLQGSSKQYDVHSRTWFASTIDDVIVAKFKCISTTSDSDGCLSVLIGLARDRRPAQLTSLFRITNWFRRRDYSSREFDTDASSKTINKGSLILERDMLAITASLHQSAIPSETFPEVEFCGVLHCLRGTLQVAGDYISCTHSNEMLLIAHISQIAKNISAARDRCWTTVETAIFRGYNSLYQRHIRRFSQAMSKSELCIGHDVPDFEFTSTVKGPGGQKIDMKFLNSFQWFSKYLLYSSSQQSVSNLQGIWADGPTSAWNGDYHFNINLQMTYWPIYSMGIAKELILPLSRFITQIASSGGNTARELYSCQGWVAHAFTDGSLDTRILGDLEWSLCVTCGAWLALHLWEHLTHVYDSQFLTEVFLPTFKGISEFFQSYMFIGPDGYMHTGPTTSPENSFRINRQSDEDSFSQVAFSPAFDMSILRHSCNAYQIASRWGLSDPNLKSEYMLQFLNEHSLSAKSFCRLVSKMKNSANPIVDNNTMTLLEYPINRWVNRSIFSGREISMTEGTSVLLEPTDWGHRHFSSLHWLYPGASMSIDSPQDWDLFEAAKSTLTLKSKNGGGHTGWSAAWEACLWSRLREPDLALVALLKLFQRYTAPNFMGLHPVLVRSNPDCRTCFAHHFHNQEVVEAPKRGLVDKHGSVFQIDANSGAYSALSQMIIQSHLPNIVHLLPSIPQNFSLSGPPVHYTHLTQVLGRIRRWPSRGGLYVSMDWKLGIIEYVLLEIEKSHPWFSSHIVEKRKGYLDISNSTNYYVSLISPNKLTVRSPSTCFFVNKVGNSRVSIIRKEEDHVLQFRFTSFPCHICLCSNQERCSCLDEQ